MLTQLSLPLGAAPSVGDGVAVVLAYIDRLRGVIDAEERVAKAAQQAAHPGPVLRPWTPQARGTAGSDVGPSSFSASFGGLSPPRPPPCADHHRWQGDIIIIVKV